MLVEGWPLLGVGWRMSWPPPHRLDYLLSFKAIFRKEGCLSFTGDKDVVVPNHPSSSSGFQGKVSLFQAPLLVDPVNFCYWTYLVLVSVENTVGFGFSFQNSVSPLPAQSRSDSPSFCVFVVNTCPHLLSRLPAGLQSPAPEFIVDVESMDIFPVGWCEANSYPLTTPHKTACEYCPTRSLAGHIWDLGEKIGNLVKRAEPNCKNEKMFSVLHRRAGLLSHSSCKRLREMNVCRHFPACKTKSQWQGGDECLGSLLPVCMQFMKKFTLSTIHLYDCIWESTYSPKVYPKGLSQNQS